MKKNIITTSGNSVNVLASGTVLKGNVIAEEDFRIDGTVEGNIECKGKVVIGSQGEVRGNIQCPNVELAGKVDGNMEIFGILVLKSTSSFTGEVVTQRLEIEPGAIFNGICKMQ